MAFWNKKKNYRQTFSDIMRGMQYSVNAAQQILERHHLYLLGKYFDEAGNPRMRNFVLSPDRILSVPEITLIPQHSLSIDEMEVDFDAYVDGTGLKEQSAEGTNNSTYEMDRACFQVDVTSSSGNHRMMHVKIKFKSSEQPEGVSRVIDEYNKQIGVVAQNPESC